MNEANSKPKSSKSGIIILVILVALFALPEIIVVGLKVIKWRPESTTNRGELVVPARQIKDDKFKTIDDKEIKFSALQGKWSMLTFANADCDEICLKNLYIMRQVHKALGKEQDRCQRIFVPMGTGDMDKLKAKLKDYPGMTIISGPRLNVDTLAQQFILPGAAHVDFQRVYLVDPMGNLMMTYSSDPTGMLKDLIHLMKTSWAG